MDTKSFEQLAEIRKQLSALEAAEEILRAKCFEEMEKNKKKTFELDGIGNFTVTVKTKHVKYPDKVMLLKEKYEIAKVKAEDNHETETAETRYITYKPVKIGQTNDGN